MTTILYNSDDQYNYGHVEMIGQSKFDDGTEVYVVVKPYPCAALPSQHLVFIAGRDRNGNYRRNGTSWHGSASSRDEAIGMARNWGYR